MKQTLNNEEIAMINNQIAKSNLQSKELQDDLVDHLCCVVEDLMNKGQNFDDALKNASQMLSPEGLNEIENETLFVMNSKSLLRLRRAKKILGFSSIAIASLGIVLKIFHLPTANLVLILGAFSLIFGFLPLYFICAYKEDFHRHLSARKKNMFGYISLSIIVIAIICKLFHLPGTNLLFVLGLLLLNFGFMPYLFFKKYKKSECA